MCGVSVLCIAATGGRVGGMGVCVWRPPVGVWAERQSVTARQRTTQCVCACVCGVGGGGVRGGGGVFMGCVCVGGDACVHAVWGWGWGCVYGGRG